MKSRPHSRASSGNAKKRLLIILFLILLFITILVSITIGNYRIPVFSVFQSITARLGFGSVTDNNYMVLVFDIRLPRVLLAALGGMCLSLSGTTFQGIFRNPLVEPYILGISSGAAFGAALSIVFLRNIIPIGISAFIFSILAMMLSYFIATKGRKTSLVNLILSGLIVGAIFAALLNLIKSFAPDNVLREIIFWLMGGYYIANWSDVLVMLPITIISLIALTSLGWKLNVLVTGDEEARSLGVNVAALKLVLIGISTFLTASIVSRCGIISWVGLMIPHASRLMIGSDNRFLLPFSAIFGAIFMIICDTAARTIIMGEIPISVVTSIIGAPYLIFLIRKNRQVDL